MAGDCSCKSGPPHVKTMRVKTEKANLAVWKSVISLVRCSMVEMTVAKVGWLTIVSQQLVFGPRSRKRTLTHKY